MLVLAALALLPATALADGSICVDRLHAVDKHPVPDAKLQRDKALLVSIDVGAKLRIDDKTGGSLPIAPAAKHRYQIRYLDGAEWDSGTFTWDGTTPLCLTSSAGVRSFVIGAVSDEHALHRCLDCPAGKP